MHPSYLIPKAQIEIAKEQILKEHEVFKDMDPLLQEALHDLWESPVMDNDDYQKYWLKQLARRNLTAQTEWSSSQSLNWEFRTSTTGGRAEVRRSHGWFKDEVEAELAIVEHRYRTRGNFSVFFDDMNGDGSKFKPLTQLQHDMWTHFSELAFNFVYVHKIWGTSENEHKRWKSEHSRQQLGFDVDDSDIRDDFTIGFSGGGSTLSHTAGLRKNLRRLIDKLNIGRLLDWGAGDMNWMRRVLKDEKQLSYIGVEISRIWVSRVNRELKSWEGRDARMIFGDVTNPKFFRNVSWIIKNDFSPLESEKKTAIFTRDALQHVPLTHSCVFFHNVWRFHKELGARYLIVGSLPQVVRNICPQFVPGAFRPDVQKWPFRLPGLIKQFRETVLEENQDTLEKEFDGFDSTPPTRKENANGSAKWLYVFDLTQWDVENDFQPCWKFPR